MPKSSGKILLVVSSLLLAIFLVAALFFKDSLPSFLFSLAFNKNINIEKHDSRINLLLLGTAGGEHEGPDLTDTIIFVSLDPGKNEVTLASIPRDLYLGDLKGKINTAYVLGSEKRKGGGLILARAAVSKIIGQPVDYALKIDFAGFTRAVDLVGGIEIDVENAFDDFEYPIANRENDACGKSEEEMQMLATSSANPQELFPCRFERLHFDAGSQKMNGEAALKFVRSRNAQGDEGTDFARSRRQQKVMVALKNKLFTAQTLLNPLKIISLYKVLAANIDSDIQMSKLDDFIRLAQKMKEAKVKNIALEGLLVNPPLWEYNDAWVLIPAVGQDNFSEIQEFLRIK